LVALAILLEAHSGHSHAPPEAKLLKSPIANSAEHVSAAKPVYEKYCEQCHGADGKSRTPLAGKLPERPADLTSYLIDSRRDGEIYWVITHGIGKNMPAFEKQIPEAGRWEVVQYVRELRAKQRAAEKARLGP